MLVCLMLSQRPLKLLSLQKKFFFFCSVWMSSITLSAYLSTSLHHLSTLLLILSTVLSTTVIVFFHSVWFFMFSNSLLKFSLCLSILLLSLLRIFMIITLNHLSSRLLPSVLVSSFSEVLSVPSLFGAHSSISSVF